MTSVYESLEYDAETIRQTVLTNICRMFVRRGYMDINNYNKGVSKDSLAVAPSNDEFNNDLFLPFIKERTDLNVYTIPLDKPYINQSSNSSFNGSKLIVKIVYSDLKDVNNTPILEDFYKKHENFHKLIVFNNILDKHIYKKKNIEFFDEAFLMIDLMSHEIAPISCSIVSIDDISYIKNPINGYIYINDPITRYYNAKKTDILRIVRPSINNGLEFTYKTVTDAKSVFH